MNLDVALYQCQDCGRCFREWHAGAKKVCFWPRPVEFNEAYLKPVDNTDGLTAAQWRNKLAVMGEHIEKDGKSASLCVIGAVACMLDGMDGRTSLDCDVWMPRSKFHPRVLEDAATAAGIDFNPTTEDPTRPYIQLVTPGIAQIGKFEEVNTLCHTGGLTISAPPTENLVASKLRMARAKDLADITHMLSQHPEVGKAEVKKVIATMPREEKERAEENMIFLDVLAPEISYLSGRGHESSSKDIVEQRGIGSQ